MATKFWYLSRKSSCGEAGFAEAPEFRRKEQMQMLMTIVVNFSQSLLSPNFSPFIVYFL